MKGNGADPVAAAVQAASQAVPAEKRLAGTIQLASGRKVIVNIPRDITDAELMDLVGEITTSLRRKVRQAVQAPPPPRILVPGRG